MMHEYDTMPEEAPPPPRPAFLSRFWMVFVKPGVLFEALGKNPAWFPMALFVAMGVGAVMGGMPGDFWGPQLEVEGTAPPEDMMGIVRAIIGGVISVFFFLFLLVAAAFTYVVFVFMRGDNAAFKQHLSVVAHAGIVMLVGMLVHIPLWIGTGSFEMVLSVATFFPFLPDGYLLNFFTQLQFFSLWTVVAAGIGIAALDPRRSTASTVVVLLVIQVILSLGCAALATAIDPTL